MEMSYSGKKKMGRGCLLGEWWGFRGSGMRFRLSLNVIIEEEKRFWLSLNVIRKRGRGLRHDDSSIFYS